MRKHFEIEMWVMLKDEKMDEYQFFLTFKGNWKDERCCWCIFFNFEHKMTFLGKPTTLMEIEWRKPIMVWESLKVLRSKDKIEAKEL